MIYDCFTFFNELDLLEIRLNILNDVVDRFVLVEATRTFRGNEKPLYFAENKERFAPFLDKIAHVVVDDYAPVENYIASPTSDPKLWSWAYENFQRQSIVRGLGDLKDDDTFIVSDLDEIPSPEAVRKAARLSKDGKIRLLQLDHRNYYLNFRNFAMPTWEWGPMALSGAAFRDPKTYQKKSMMGGVREVLTVTESPQRLRAMKPDAIVKNAGWHFSYIGGLDMILNKLKSYSHSEYSTGEFVDPEHVKKVIANGGDLFKNGDAFYAVEPEKCLPAFILQNREKYESLIYPTSAEYLAKTRLKKIRATIFYHLRVITPAWIKDVIYRLLKKLRRI